MAWADPTRGGSTKAGWRRFGSGVKARTKKPSTATRPTARESRSANVDTRALERVADGLAQDLTGDRRGVTLAQREVLQHVGDRVALRPAEVRVGSLLGRLLDVQEQRRDGVGDGGALAAKHAVPAHLHAAHVEVLAEVRSVAL